MIQKLIPSLWSKEEVDSPSSTFVFRKMPEFNNNQLVMRLCTQQKQESEQALRNFYGVTLSRKVAHIYKCLHSNKIIMPDSIWLLKGSIIDLLWHLNGTHFSHI